MIDGKPVDFNDAATYYNVSTVNYLAAGSCNFNDSGVSLWPLDQIVQRHPVLRPRRGDRLHHGDQGTVSPAIEGRLVFLAGDIDAPVITITSPTAKAYLHSSIVTLKFSATDELSGVASITAKLDGKTVKSGQKIDLLNLKLGSHKLTVTATDKASPANVATQSVTFAIKATTTSLVTSVRRYYDLGKISSRTLANRLIILARVAQYYQNRGLTVPAVINLAAFVGTVAANSGHRITRGAASKLIDDGIYVMWHVRNLP